eukprot:TRINITY_DN15300_c0_g1_i1.p1 TRINITY_DN15300_c0_g1~~TRINITY_DN15300_c0_g1_i1.p1  ORF type:complete len:366 (+),score=140.22 TRINITY_DN15300_c0_g1_i1:88-1098(+)
MCAAVWATLEQPWVWWVCGTAASYCIASAVLLRYPRLLHSAAPPPAFSVRYYAHRGGAAERPENTLCAFRHAVEQGAQLELDVWITTDGEVVVHHDRTLQRTAGDRRNVSDLSAADLQELPLLHERMGSSSAGAAAARGERLCLLREVFAEFPHAAVNIDLKHHEHPAAARLVAAVVAEFGARHRVVWGSMAERARRELSDADPQVPCFCSRNGIIRILLGYWTGLLPFMPLQCTFYEVPYLTPEIRHAVDSTMAQRGCHYRLLGWVAKQAIRGLTARKLVHHLQRRGVQCIAWVLNDAESVAECARLGLHGVMTDRPEGLRAAVAAAPFFHGTRP